MIIVKPPTNFSVIESLEFIWDKLHGYAEESIPYWKYEDSHPEDAKVYEEEWDEICTAMAWIEDECGLERKEGILEHKKENK